MEIIPAVCAVRYEQLEPGELFLFVERGTYALKALQKSPGARSEMVVLGPNFMNGGGPSLLGWQATTVLSFGKDFSILLSSTPSEWVGRPGDRSQVWLAVGEQKTFICANGGTSFEHYVASLVDIETGEILERQSPGHVLYTNVWEIATLGSSHPPRTILKFPWPKADN
jgi:hypothetical protein